jgi:hypothetical protein
MSLDNEFQFAMVFDESSTLFLSHMLPRQKTHKKIIKISLKKQA